MSKPVPIGTKGSSQERVHFDQTLTAHHHQLPPVYSTPDMIRLMETAADEISVGTAINVEHRAPVGVNAIVKAEAVVESFDGKFYTLKVTATDGDKELGSGTIKRAIVSTKTFLDKWKIPKP